MNSLTIGLLVNRFPNVVQPYILNQIITLENAGATIQVIAGKSETDNKLHPSIDNIQLITKPAYINTSFKSTIKSIFSPSTLDKNYLSALNTIIQSNCWKEYGAKELLRRFIFAKALLYQHFNVIHSHSLFTSYDYLFLQQNFSIPLITTYHGVLPPGVPRLDDKKMQMVFDMGNLFLVNTMSAKNDLTKLGCSARKIHVIPQGTNLDKFPYHQRVIFPEKKIILLSVGRLSPEKGHRTAIEAAAELVKEFPTIEYHIVGDGPERKTLQRLAIDLGLAKTIIFEGFIQPDEIINYYTTSHILLLPSIQETQGTVLQEAQASGLPVIGSRAGGIPEVIIENKTGLLFNTTEPADLANKIRLLISSPNLYDELAIHGRKDVAHRFDIKVVCKQLISSYQNIIEQ